jgi:hypothetical protein
VLGDGSVGDLADRQDRGRRPQLASRDDDVRPLAAERVADLAQQLVQHPARLVGGRRRQHRHIERSGLA